MTPDNLKPGTVTIPMCQEYVDELRLNGMPTIAEKAILAEWDRLHPPEPEKDEYSEKMETFLYWLQSDENDCEDIMDNLNKITKKHQLLFKSDLSGKAQLEAFAEELKDQFISIAGAEYRGTFIKEQIEELKFKHLKNLEG